MSEILRLKAERETLRREKTRLALAADAAIRAAKSLLATSAVTPLADLELGDAAGHMAEACRIQADLVAVVKKIHAIDRELGE